MANVNVKFGLKPISVIGGGINSTSQYFIKSDASAIFQGSPVEVELTGGTAAIITSADGDGKQLLGVFAGCEYVDASTGKLTFKNTWAGSGPDNIQFFLLPFLLVFVQALNHLLRLPLHSYPLQLSETCLQNLDTRPL